MENKQKIALITGITGQDGSYLAEFLLGKGYKVHGIIRKSSSFNTGRIDHIYNNPDLSLHYGDLTDSLSIDNVIQDVKPDEIYHLGAQSHVHVSFQLPKYTGEVDALGTLYLLESIRKHCPESRFYNATTSELYGKVQCIPQNEQTPFYPRSPYGVAKLYSYWITKNYRESYDMFTVNGILFNHESERRGKTFVTRKITLGLAEYLKTGEPLYLGNLDAKRDWGYAPDYVRGMWLMLQANICDDYVLATGVTHTIKEFIEECMKHVDSSDWVWDVDEKGRDILWDKYNSTLVIGIDEQYYRPAEVEILLGDASHVEESLGWEPKVHFEELVQRMMTHDNHTK
jgi:GDPmannose 4,6-dehydratase